MNVPHRVPVIHVKAGVSPQDAREYRFDRSFTIGRSDECEVVLKSDFVSRRHVTVEAVDGGWQVRDLGSANGIFSAGERVAQVRVGDKCAVRLGAEGPWVLLKLEPQPQPVAEPLPSHTMMVASIEEKYLGELKDGQQVGARTMLIRQAFQKAQKKQRSKFVWIASALALIASAAGGYAWYQSRQIRMQTAVASQIFYAMKALDVDIANVQRAVAESGREQDQAQVRSYRTRRKEMEDNYNRFLSGLQQDKKLSERERLILRMARVFGECELTAPKDFASLVESYIQKWQSTPRYAAAIARAAQNGYSKRISEEFLNQDLPPQFFYLAMQESGFDPHISGPETYMGIAKGMWQFIPKTATEYGLKIGPLAAMRRPDPGDDRHDWEKATGAAARYIKFLYSTDAQASGLLVMASYNWGEEKVIRLLRTMPANPQERNFWKLLAKYRDKLPDETYDYVFYIFAAAVIGENPRLFGFPFDNPLGHLEGK